MNNFIEVEFTTNGEKCLINVNNITLITNNGNYCTIYFSGEYNNCTSVNETYENLKDLIKKMD